MRMFPKVRLLVLWWTSVTVLPVIVQAWGKQGHEIVGNLAWTLLSNVSRTIVSNILSNTNEQCPGCSPLGNVADWADEIRYRYHWSAPLHYVDVRDDLIATGCPVLNRTTNDQSQPTLDSNNKSTSCHFMYERDCVDNRCVAGAIVNYTLLLPDQDALKFLTHFVGDIHQPLHVARNTDRGGNDIRVHYSAATRKNKHATTAGRLRKTEHRRNHHAHNLHAVWDDAIIETCLERDFRDNRTAMEDSLRQLIQKARSNGQLQRWLHCANGASVMCTRVWSEESLHYALIWAYRDIDGRNIVDGTNLTQQYYETRLPVVREQLAKAGVRLAATLDTQFKQMAYR